VIGPGVIIALGGLLLIWVAIRMWQGRLPRNSIAGVRTPTTMRSSEAFDIANKAAAPLAAAAGVFLTAGGLAAAILADDEGATALLAGTLACAALAIVGGIIGVRACR
jgi:uncharacterized membrane protein